MADFGPWEDLSTDLSREAEARARSTARAIVLPVWPVLANAVDREDFANRREIVSATFERAIEEGARTSGLSIEAVAKIVDAEIEADFGHLAVRHTAPGGGEHAPYRIKEDGGKYYVVNDLGERKNSEGYDSEEQARNFQKALYANVPGASESAKEDESKKSSKTAGEIGPGVYDLDARTKVSIGDRVRWDGDMANVGRDGTVTAVDSRYMDIRWDPSAYGDEYNLDARRTPVALLDSPRWHKLSSKTAGELASDIIKPLVDPGSDAQQEKKEDHSHNAEEDTTDLGEETAAEGAGVADAASAIKDVAEVAAIASKSPELDAIIIPLLNPTREEPFDPEDIHHLLGLASREAVNPSMVNLLNTAQKLVDDSMENWQVDNGASARAKLIGKHIEVDGIGGTIVSVASHPEAKPLPVGLYGFGVLLDAQGGLALAASKTAKVPNVGDKVDGGTVVEVHAPHTYVIQTADGYRSTRQIQWIDSKGNPTEDYPHSASLQRAAELLAEARRIQDEKISDLKRCAKVFEESLSWDDPIRLGDVINIDGRFYRCATLGFEAVEEVDGKNPFLADENPLQNPIADPTEPLGHPADPLAGEAAGGLPGSNTERPLTTKPRGGGNLARLFRRKNR